MITSHGYPTPPGSHPHHHAAAHHENNADFAELKTASDSSAIGQRATSASAASDMMSVPPDAFSPHFGGEDDFDIPPINIPQSALDDQQMHQHQHYGNYQYQQHQHVQQQQMYQQQQWGQQQQQVYMNGYGPQYDHYGYGYGQMYPQQQTMPQQVLHSTTTTTSLPPGGPSPVGSHNTPSPQAHSEDGEDHIRNNNVLKRPSEQPHRPPMMGHPHPHHHHHHHMHSPSSLYVNTAKKPKVSKRKKKRDPNEPQKPVSAYALFFRDSQASIKIANPNAAFGDVSKIVASMWDGLDPDNKAAYKKRTENAKKEYLKKLAAYRASLVSKGTGDGTNPYGAYGAYASTYAELQNGGSMMATGQNSGVKPGGYIHGTSGYMQPVPPRPPMQQHGYMMHHGQPVPNNGLSTGSLDRAPPPQQSSPRDQQPSPSSDLSENATPTQNGRVLRCARPGCANPVQQRSGWGDNSEFCSSECVVGQCREVYTNWSSNNSGQQQQQQQNSTSTAQQSNTTSSTVPQYTTVK